MGKINSDPVGINAQSGDVTYDGGEWRRHQAGPFIHNSNPVVAMPGVLSGMAVSVNDDLVASIGHGSSIVSPLPATASAGSYRVTIASSPTENLVAADNTYDRRDIVCLEVRDPDTTGGTEKGAWMVVKTGQPAQSPVAPTPDDGQLLLGEVLVPVTGAPSVIDRRTYTAAAGAVIPCTRFTRPDPAGWMRIGQPAFETDTGTLIFWDGSAWVGSTQGRPPLFTGYIAAQQSIPTSSETAVRWGDNTPAGSTSVASWTSGAHEAMTIKRSGIHRVNVRVTLEGGTASGYIHLRYRENGNLTNFIEEALPSTRAVTQFDVTNYFAAGTQLSFGVFQTSGGSRNVSTDFQLSRLEIIWISE